MGKTPRGLPGQTLVTLFVVVAASAIAEDVLAQPTATAAGGAPFLQVRLGAPLRLPTALPEDDSFASTLPCGRTVPTALAAGDLDGDGVADLLVGYATAEGGVLALHRVDPSAVFAGRSRASGTAAPTASHESPFLPGARFVAVPIRPDALATGDFDGDGRSDVVVVALGGSVLWFLSGDGRGGFPHARAIPLPGAATALASGEVDRADGLADLVVGVDADGKGMVLVFEAPGGALTGPPEMVHLPTPPTALALGPFDGDGLLDLAAVSRDRLFLLRGRDRRLSLDETSRRSVPAPRVDTIPLAGRAVSIAAGHFTSEGRPGADLALLAEDGTVHVLSAPATEGASPEAGRSAEPLLPDRRARGRDVRESGAPPIPSLPALVDTGPSTTLLSAAMATSRLVKVRVSGLAMDDLVVAGAPSAGLPVFAPGASPTDAPRRFTLDAEGPAAAVLPLRLNADAFDDLVLVPASPPFESEGTAPAAERLAPFVMMTAPVTVYAVNTTGDEHDSAPGDGLCRSITTGRCSLRGAIEEANAHAGADEIDFNLGTGTPSIHPLSDLPSITQPVTIRGDTGGATRIEVTGSGSSTGQPAFLLAPGSAGSVLRSLVVNGSSGAAIELRSGNNFVENCYLGTDAAGATAHANLSGVHINGASSNTIGGTTVAQRNVISGNGFAGIETSGANLVIGNIIGLDATGSTDITTMGDGVLLESSAIDTIGGSTLVPGTPPGNVISGNSAGVHLYSASNKLVQGNLIGTNADGTSARGNGTGITTRNGSNFNTIGGTTLSLRNVVSGNATGVDLYAASGSATYNLVQGDWIGTDVTGFLPLGNTGSGVVLEWSPSFSTIGGITSVAGTPPGNVIVANGVDGIRVTNSGTTFNSVLGNRIGDTQPGGSLGNAGHGVHITCQAGATCGSAATTVGSSPSASQPCGGGCNAIVGNGGAGIRIDDASTALDLITANSIYGNGGLGIDLGPAGTTPNDAGDADSGANGLQNFPVLESADDDGSSTTVSGHLDSAPDTTYDVDVYDNAGGDPSGYGEGQTYLGTVSTTTDGSGHGAFVFVAPGSHAMLAATAREQANGNTSEFSATYSNPREVSPSGLAASRGSGTSVALSYAPSCGALDHVVYLGAGGPSSLGGLSWTSAFCALGTNGSAVIDPGDPAAGTLFYFVIVGQNATREGSYGRASSGQERPEAVGVGSCDLPRGLGATCP